MQKGDRAQEMQGKLVEAMAASVTSWKGAQDDSVRVEGADAGNGHPAVLGILDGSTSECGPLVSRDMVKRLRPDGV